MPDTQLKQGRMMFENGPSILHDTVDVFEPPVLQKLGATEAIEVLLRVSIQERGASDRSVWLLKSGPDLFYITSLPYDKYCNMESSEVWQIVQPKPMKDIVKNLQAGSLHKASKIGELKKEGILAMICLSRRERGGFPHAIPAKRGAPED